MGDTQFFQLIADLSKARHPLVQVTDSCENRLGEVRLTETGRKVLDGEADHVDLNGIDRWLGGVYLTEKKGVFRWDRATSRIVKNP